MQKAHEYGALTYFDLNYRAKLWAPIGGLKQAQKVLRKITEYIDVLLGNEEDLQTGLGIPGPDVERKDKFDTTTFFAMIERVTEQFTQVKAVATTLREVISAKRHNW